MNCCAGDNKVIGQQPGLWMDGSIRYSASQWDLPVSDDTLSVSQSLITIPFRELCAFISSQRTSLACTVLGFQLNRSQWGNNKIKSIHGEGSFTRNDL